MSMTEDWRKSTLLMVDAAEADELMEAYEMREPSEVSLEQVDRRRREKGGRALEGCARWLWMGWKPNILTVVCFGGRGAVKLLVESRRSRYCRKPERGDGWWDTRDIIASIEGVSGLGEDTQVSGVERSEGVYYRVLARVGGGRKRLSPGLIRRVTRHGESE